MRRTLFPIIEHQQRIDFWQGLIACTTLPTLLEKKECFHPQIKYKCAVTFLHGNLIFKANFLGVNFLLVSEFSRVFAHVHAVYYKEICSIYFCTNKLSLVLSNYTPRVVPSPTRYIYIERHNTEICVCAKIGIAKLGMGGGAYKKCIHEKGTFSKSHLAIKIHAIKTRILELSMQKKSLQL